MSHLCTDLYHYEIILLISGNISCLEVLSDINIAFLYLLFVWWIFLALYFQSMLFFFLILKCDSIGQRIIGAYFIFILTLWLWKAYSIYIWCYWYLDVDVSYLQCFHICPMWSFVLPLFFLSCFILI